MFIPTWLLILILLVAISVFVPRFWGELWGLVSCLVWLGVIVSFIAAVIFFARSEYYAAAVLAAPMLAAGAWWMLKEARQEARASAALYERRLRAARSPDAVEKLSREFVTAIGLGRKLWQLRDDVKHFPSWYKATNPDGTPWTSNVIRKNQIVEIADAAEAKAVGLDPSVLEPGGPYLVYSFTVGGRRYAFCTRDHMEGFSYGSDGAFEDACGGWVIEEPARVVLAMRLDYYSHESGYFKDSNLQTFRLGPWLDALLTTAERVHADEEQKHANWEKQRAREKAERNFG